MVPFEHGRRGIHRFGSSSTMADVFEEDEEDEDGANKSNDSSADTTPQATPAIEKGENASSVVVSSASSQSSSHGERSKLSMEVTYSSDTEKKQPKVSKTKRLSKMVQFWKPKQNASA
ncbi:putative cell wall proline rich protein [Phaeoacremonium minimum UCRPA7]|uniref:Putative cell wall proline rich protein n=1 Tax=Phaeoacremonium minimum (strain UCR-PA7) TaxID=1286976 RepID=R8BRW1_PHAM7|nr:putative cell wall proline rich protein [Phaeoacremonium minimum UCRPA7]EOO02107.1 putative cell wall proline rich protein [Phaeoacremonium minimum UCRPA7]